MPVNLSLQSVDAIINDFTQKILSPDAHCEVLLRMKEVKQVYTATLTFITKLYNTITNAGSSLYIVEVTDPVANALRFNNIHEKIHIFKDMLDFERDKGTAVIDSLDLDTEEDTANPIFKELSDYTVMLIEPSLLERNNQKSVLKKLPFKSILENKECAEALRRINEGTTAIDLMILNIEEAKWKGIELIKSLFALPIHKKCKIILTTSHNITDKITQEALLLGARAVLQYPFTLEDFKRTLAVL